MMLAPFAQRLGIPVGRLKSYELARAPLRYGLAAKLPEEFDINLLWLATGEEPRKPCFTIEPLLAGELPEKELFSRVFQKILEEPFRNQVAMLKERGYRPKDLSQPHGRLVIKTICQPVLASPFSIRHIEAMEFAERIERLGHFIPDEVDLLTQQLDEQVYQFEQKHRDEILKKQAARTNALDVERKSYRDWVRERLSTGKIVDIHKNTLLTGNTETRNVEPDETRISHMQTEKHFPTRLTQALNKASLTVAAASQKWGINRRTIEDWKQGRSTPRGINLRVVEEALASIQRKA